MSISSKSIPISFSVFDEGVKQESNAFLKYEYKTEDDNEYISMIVFMAAKQRIGKVLHLNGPESNEPVTLFQITLTNESSNLFSKTENSIKWELNKKKYEISFDDEEHFKSSVNLFESISGCEIPELFSDDNKCQSEDQDEDEPLEFKKDSDLFTINTLPRDIQKLKLTDDNKAKEKRRFIINQMKTFLNPIDLEDKYEEEEEDSLFIDPENYESPEMNEEEDLDDIIVCSNDEDEVDYIEDDDDHPIFNQLSISATNSNHKIVQKTIKFIEKIKKEDSKHNYNEKPVRIRDTERAPILPDPRVENLKQILEKLQKSNKKKDIIAFLTDESNDWLLNLGMQFQSYETSNQSAETLFLFYEIYLEILELNDKDIVCRLVSDSCYQGFFGALEHNPNFPLAKFTYRNDIDNGERLKNSILKEYNDLKKRAMICHRLVYLKESVVNNNFEETTLAVLNHQCFFKNMDLLRSIVVNPRIYMRFFPQKRDKDNINDQTIQEDINDCDEKLSFFLECISVVKSLQMPSLRNDFLHQMNKDDRLFQMLSNCLSIPQMRAQVFTNCEQKEKVDENKDCFSEFNYNINFTMDDIDNRICRDVVEILILFCFCDLSYIQNLIVADMKKNSSDNIIKRVIFALLHTKNEGVMLQIESLIKVLIEPQIMTSGFDEMTILILNEVMIPCLFPFLEQIESLNANKEDFYFTSNVIISIVRSCLMIKSQKELFGKLLENKITTITGLYPCAPKYVKLTIIKFISDCASLFVKDLNEKIIESNIISKMMDTLRECMKSQSLIFSSIWSFIKIIQNKGQIRLCYEIIKCFNEEDEKFTLLNKVLDPIRKLIGKQRKLSISFKEINKQTQDSQSDDSLTQSDDELDKALIERSRFIGSLRHFSDKHDLAEICSNPFLSKVIKESEQKEEIELNNEAPKIENKQECSNVPKESYIKQLSIIKEELFDDEEYFTGHVFIAKQLLSSPKAIEEYKKTIEDLRSTCIHKTPKSVAEDIAKESKFGSHWDESNNKRAKLEDHCNEEYISIKDIKELRTAFENYSKENIVE